MQSGNRDVNYRYGKNGELLRVQESCDRSIQGLVDTCNYRRRPDSAVSSDERIGSLYGTAGSTDMSKPGGSP